jgi:threonine/homoserine/homoserine lactone efflux protein
MDWTLFARGLLIGGSVAAPVGPMSILFMRRTIADGRAMGLLAGLGIAAADATFGAIAALGLAAISSRMVAWQEPVRVVGGLFLVWLGLSAMRKPVTDRAPSSGTDRGRHAKAFFATFGLTLTNPATILSFAAIFSGAGFVSQERDFLSAMLLVAGVFSGSMIWWAILAVAIGRLRGQLNPQLTIAVNWAAGGFMLVFGLLAIASVLR